MIARVFGRLPDHVTYVPVEFGKERLDQALAKAEYDSEQWTLFIAEGLLMYIPPAAVDALLVFIRNGSGPQSAIVADYFDTSVVDGTSALKEARVLKAFGEKEGAPLQFGIPEEGVEDFFRQRGFSSVTRVTPDWCRKTYFPAASRNRPVSPMFNFVYAMV